jgi:hypothetical protein
MPSTILEDISAAIAAIGGRSTFAIEESAPTSDLELRVQGVGRVRLPITHATAEKLIAAARPAPFGVRDETRYDESVRSSWEIPADRITVGTTFERTLAARLDTICRRLSTLAPNASALADGRKTADPRVWARLGQSAEALWGECKESPHTR